MTRPIINCKLNIDNYIHMPLFISELLPNPAGKDTAGEWIELCNTDTAPAPLVGKKLSDASGKTYVFGDESLAPRSCVVYPYVQTKITLNNSGDTITLADVQGTVIDTLRYAESIGDDIALARDKDMRVALTSRPTPGKENSIVPPAPDAAESGVWDVGYNTGTAYETTTSAIAADDEDVIVSDVSVLDVAGTGVLVACCATICFWYFFKKLHAVS